MDAVHSQTMLAELKKYNAKTLDKPRRVILGIGKKWMQVNW